MKIYRIYGKKVILVKKESLKILIKITLKYMSVL